MSGCTTNLRRRLIVRGVVQGVGFRPFVFRLAQTLGICGFVTNTSDGVLIELEGRPEQLQHFRRMLTAEAPALSDIQSVVEEEIAPVCDAAFAIVTSQDSGTNRTLIPADIAVCPDCLSDISVPGNPRFEYPFTNCTNCGPRFTIIQSIPYDRSRTTMADFELCGDCRAEYENPLNRRFHAEPVACPKCGPHLKIDSVHRNDAECIMESARLIGRGKILAIKGLGGYHLACDATNDKAVNELRRRKGRMGKPLAVMCRDLDVVTRIAFVSDEEASLLQSPESPIVILKSNPHNRLSHAVTGGINTVGAMLPYTPLHSLLFSHSPDILVMTSGNLSEEPIATDDSDAHLRLGNIADHVLKHNRGIHLACDDSVAKVVAKQPLVIRRARGYTPRVIPLMDEAPHILACGGDLKSAFCLAKDKQALLSQHIGDLENSLSIQHYERTVEHFQSFFCCLPRIVAHDLHPDYHSTRFALQQTTLSTLAVQHHWAHTASCLAENGEDGPVIGVSFDGTGFGEDGAIWGGEFLVASLESFERVAHLKYIPLPGGDAAARRPGRVAISHIRSAFGDEARTIAVRALPWMTDEETAAVFHQCERNIGCIPTSSMGRLFDAVGAITGICHQVSYEGQAAMELESLCSNERSQKDYFFIIEEGDTLIIDPAPVIRSAIHDAMDGVSPAAIAASFHQAVARMIVDVCLVLSKRENLTKVALSGGVFQNTLLTELCVPMLEQSGFHILRHSFVPAGDGGLALGQAAIAARRFCT